MTSLVLSVALVLTPAPISAPKEPVTWPTSPPTASTVDFVPTVLSWPPEIRVEVESLFAPTESPAPNEPPPPPPVEPPPPPPMSPPSLTDNQLYRLRMCESTDNYGAHLVWGTQWESRATGAYQFEQPTWDGVARRHMPWLVGVRPHHAWPAEQDAMARWLWSERGRQPWPVCGYRVGAP